jgi:hypothetical protein
MPKAKPPGQTQKETRTKSIEDTLPTELLDRILRFYREEFENFEYQEMFKILTVSKSWAVSVLRRYLCIVLNS